MGSYECKAQIPDTLNIPIQIPLPDDPPPLPDKSPVYSNVWGIVNVNQHLTLYVDEIIAIEVRIYLNGILVVSDDAPVLLGNTLCYNLSTFGSGAYTVELYADDQNVYIGQFNL